MNPNPRSALFAPSLGGVESLALQGRRSGMPRRRLYGLPPWGDWSTTLDGRSRKTGPYADRAQIRAAEKRARRAARGAL